MTTRSRGSRFVRVILGEPIVFYRLEDGTPVALEDRCAHRHLPLSMGKLVGDTCNATIMACATIRPAPVFGCRART